MAKKYYASIKANKSALANMPQNVVMKYYPKMPYGLTSNIDDTITGIDNQLRKNNPSNKGIFKPKKY